MCRYSKTSDEEAAAEVVASIVYFIGSHFSSSSSCSNSCAALLFISHVINVIKYHHFQIDVDDKVVVAVVGLAFKNLLQAAKRVVCGLNGSHSHGRGSLALSTNRSIDRLGNKFAARILLVLEQHRYRHQNVAMSVTFITDFMFHHISAVACQQPTLVITKL